MKNNNRIEPSVASVRIKNIKQDLEMLEVKATKIMKQKACLILKLIETREELLKNE